MRLRQRGQSMSFDDDRNRKAGPWGSPPEAQRPPSIDPLLGGPRPGGFGRRLLIIVCVVGAGFALLFIVFPPSFIDKGNETAFLQYGVIGAVLLMSLAASRRSLPVMAGQLAIWALIALVIVALYGYRSELSDVGRRVMAELVPTRGAQMQGGAMVFTRSADRQFHIDADVDGVPVRFLVDTGASSVVLTLDDAARLGFSRQSLSFTQDFQTANGMTRGAPVTLREIRIGNIRFSDVQASVNEGDLDHSLLGMHLLERLSSIEIRKDQLIIKP
jgi:aspartyl protease family protein